MNGWGQGLLILIFFAASALFSGMETGGYQLNRIRLRVQARHGNPASLRLQRVLSDAHIFIFTVLIGNNIAVYLISHGVTLLYLDSVFRTPHEPIMGFIPWNAETAATLTLLLPLFLFAEIIPKNLFHRKPDTLMYRASGLLLFFWWVFRPLTAILKLFFNLLTGGRGRSEALNGFSFSLQGLRDYFSDVSGMKTLSEHQHGMIDNLVSMHRVPVRKLMKPIDTRGSVSSKSTCAQVLDRMRTGDVEELMIYRGSHRNLTGFVTLFDLMDPAVSPTDPLRSYVRKTASISADQPLSRAFTKLRRSPSAPAIITDRSSKAVGILHLRDIADYIASAR
ncbi:MAG: DUF21 domain-containing protein [Kiritimatiellales bacterium]|nr:DUF21 domain-containing protein [Kiritimatiellota bacterium]MBL7011864.1 DUF21 domain-containing protein [Kiritimatiellales bacterium]